MMSRITFGLFFCLCILATYLYLDGKFTQVPALAQSISTDWPQLQHDAHHTGRTQTEVAPSYKVLWAWFDKGHIAKNFISAPGKSITDGFEPGFVRTTVVGGQVQPVISGGKVFFGTVNGSFHAVDALSGDNRWDYKTSGPILGTAAVAGNTVVVGSMDSNVYFLDTANGSLKWKYHAGAGISASVTVFQNTAYVGSRDGSMYAFDLASNPIQLKWQYVTRVNGSETVNFAKAPIVAPAAVSEDGSTVVFGAENMYVYALSSNDGKEKWPPKKVVGQSFLYSWPVIQGNNVIVRTMSSLPGAETGIVSPDIEPLLAQLPADPTWTQEKAAVQQYLNQNPDQKTMYVFDLSTGNEPYQVAMGRVSGNNFVPHLAVIDNQNRVLTYWRSKKSTFFTGGTFGSNYCPDLSALNMSTGDRIPITAGGKSLTSCPELDNGFQPSSGGNYLYMGNAFRGVHAVNLVTGAYIRLTTPVAHFDGGDFRGWGTAIIYYGNDAQPTTTTSDPGPQAVMKTPDGFIAPAIASTNGTAVLYVNEGDVGAIVAISQQ